MIMPRVKFGRWRPNATREFSWSCTGAWIGRCRPLRTQLLPGVRLNRLASDCAVRCAWKTMGCSPTIRRKWLPSPESVCNGSCGHELAATTHRAGSQPCKVTVGRRTYESQSGSAFGSFASMSLRHGKQWTLITWELPPPRLAGPLRGHEGGRGVEALSMKHDEQHLGNGRGEPGGAREAGLADGSGGPGGPGGHTPSRESGGPASHGRPALRRAPGPPPTSAPPHNAGRRRLRPAGGYRKLASFQVATLIYDATVWFCEKFMDPRSRTVDQMVQAARSGRQNIAEGNRFGATSSQTELRLVNTARASLEELLLDYEDYLRHRHLAQWEADGAEAGAVRAVGRRGDLSDMTDRKRRELYAPWLEHDDPAIRANAILCLIHQANYLLDQHLAALERAFIEEGSHGCLSGVYAGCPRDFRSEGLVHRAPGAFDPVCSHLRTKNLRVFVPQLVPANRLSSRTRHNTSDLDPH